MTQPTVARLDVPFHGGTIHLTVFGAEQAASPLQCVPGGPGLPHDYLTPLTALATERPVVLYDLIGTGRSTRLQLPWSRALLAEELHVIRSHLGSAPIDLYLHSAAIRGADDLWGYPHRYRRVITSIFCASTARTPSLSDEMRRSPGSCTQPQGNRESPMRQTST